MGRGQWRDGRGQWPKWVVGPIGWGLVRTYDAGMTRYATALHIRLSTTVRRVVTRECGASMVEYVLLVSLIAIALVIAVGFFGNALRSEFSDIGTSVGNA